MPYTNPGPAVSTTQQTTAEMVPTNTNGLPVPVGTNGLRLLARAIGVNANAVADTLMPVINSSSYSVLYVIKTNASISLTTATGGVYTAAAAGGTAVLTPAALSGNTAANVVVQTTPTTTTVQTAQTLFWRIATAQGTASTVDIFVYGYDFSPLTA